MFGTLSLALAGALHGGPNAHAPDRDWDTEHVHLDLSIDPEAGAIQGTVTFDLQAIRPDSRTVRLDQIDLRIDAVRVDGEPHDFIRSDRALTLDLAGLERAQVEIDYHGHPNTGLHFRGPGDDSPDSHTEVWSQGEGSDTRHWIPIHDHPNDRFTFSSRWTVPEGLKVLSNGLGGEVSPGVWEYAMDQDMVAYLIMVAVGDYTIREDAWRDIPVQQWLPPGTAMVEAEFISGDLPAMLDFFSERTGVDYPYPAYREVYVQRFLYVGMENVTSTVMAEHLLRPAELQLTSRRGESVVAHELAHQWYGDLLTCRTWHELWLNEGFATFFANEWMTRKDGPEFGAMWLAGRFDSAASVGGPLSGRFYSTELGIHSDNSGVYVKGASVLRMLQVMLGDEVFWAGIQRYTRTHRDGLVESEDLRRAIEEESGMHLRWFFDQWVHLTGAPEVAAHHRFDDGELIITLSQEGDFVLPVEVEIMTEGGPIYRTVWLDTGRVTLSVETDTAPEYVALDPRGGLIWTLEHSQSAEQWSAQALDSPNPYARVRALQALAKARGPAAEQTLIAVMLNDEQPMAYRVVALKSAASIPSVVMLQTLAALLSDPDPRIRRQAATSLGYGVGMGPALAQAFGRDVNPDVRGDILQAWARQDREGARKAASQILRRPAGAIVSEHAAALRVLARTGEPADLKRVLQHLAPSTPSYVLHRALIAATGIVGRIPPGHERKAAAESVARRLEPLLTDPFLRTREAALRAAGSVGDEQTINALRAMIAQDRAIPELRVEAQIDKITARDDSAPIPEDGELEARLKALERDLEGLERDLERLETRR